MHKEFFKKKNIFLNNHLKIVTYLSIFASFEGGQLKEIVDITGHVLLYGTQSGVIKWPLLWSAQFLP